MGSMCREYMGPRTAGGYGKRFHRGTRQAIRDENNVIRGFTEGENGHYEYLHRWVWEQVNGPIPEGMVVMHTCDNSPCFLYDHLRLGTQADNLADMRAKGRGRWSS